jgi:hypothetical protein
MMRAALSWLLLSAFALAVAVCVPRGIEMAALLLAADDPAAIADHALKRRFDASVAEREIEAALSAGDADLARSFADLAADRGIAVSPDLAQRVADELRRSESVTAKATNFARGVVLGESDDAAAIAGTMLGDLFVFGDIRDVVREGVRSVRGHEPDRLILGLAGAGLAVTAGTYVSMGAAAPARAGLSLIKAAHKSTLKATKRLVGVGGSGALVRLAVNTGRIQARAGTRAALDGLRVAQHPRDLARISALAERKGSRTRAILKTLGRGAFVLTATAFNLATWIFSAILSLFGLAASIKGTAERMTRRSIERRKARLRISAAG